MKNYGCKGGLPHSLRPLKEFNWVKYEYCELCGKKYRWNKRERQRIANKEYLKAHVRNFAQRYGATREIYHRIYKPELCVIRIKI
jgi:hypothetical protein